MSYITGHKPGDPPDKEACFFNKDDFWGVRWEGSFYLIVNKYGSELMVNDLPDTIAKARRDCRIANQAALVTRQSINHQLSTVINSIRSL